MNQIFSGIFGALAVSVALGAIQLASGGDLVATGHDDNQTDENVINRSAKSDRADAARTSMQHSHTISVVLDGLSDTSIVIRLPEASQIREEARHSLPPPDLTKQPVNARKSTVACEPVVSVLTEAAKQLQPGRCIT